MFELRQRLMPGNRPLLLDGALGTELLRRGWRKAPEAAVGEAPELVRSIHADYVAAGAEVLLTACFGGTPWRLERQSVGAWRRVLTDAVNLAREAAAGREVAVCASLGPTGELPFPLGERLSGWYRDQFHRAGEVLLEAGVDGFFLETFGDLGELKQAVAALRELDGEVFLAALVSPADGARTLTGSPPAVVALTLGELGVDCLGLNCARGPAGLREPLRRLLRATALPVAVEPNAGLPRTGGKGVEYGLAPAAYAAATVELVEAGAAVVGGCCGTTPQHIAALRELLEGRRIAGREVRPASGICSANRIVGFGDGALIGEKLNPTGRPRLRRALRDGELDYPLNLARRQVNAGAAALDFNLGLESVVEPEFAERLLLALAYQVGAPVVIDVQDPALAGRLLAAYPGRALYNSSRALPGELRDRAALVRRHGGMLVVLAMGDEVPPTVRGRRALLGGALRLLEQLGFPPERCLFDPVVTAAATGQGVRPTLETLAWLTRRGLSSILGVSNVSFGLPERGALNAALASLALEGGASALICDPTAEALRDQRRATLRLLGRERPRSLEDYADEPAAVRLLLEGRAGDFKNLLQGGSTAPPAAVGGLLRPTMERIGELYAAGRIHLPQLILAAQSARPALELVEECVCGGDKRGVVVLATVRGDVHDIGKALISAVVAGAGYRVIDLGRDVPTARIVRACAEHAPFALGLSAMLTTTAPRITEIVAALRRAGLTTPVIAGGATLDRDSALGLGADYYAADAAALLGILRELEGDGADRREA